MWKTLLKSIVSALLSIPASKRVMIVAITALLGKLGFIPPEIVAVMAEHSWAILMGLLVATGISDAGKALAVKLSPSLAPTTFVPSASGGVPQAVDAEVPILDRR